MTYGRADNAAHQRRYRATERGKLATRRANLRASHGISDAEYAEMSKLQNGVCASCGNAETGRNQYGPLPLAVDHDHVTGKVRGLLCMRCNRALGLIGDNPESLARLTAYRTKHARRVYVSGGMRGLPMFNFPAFDAAAAELRADGWTVFSPADHDRASGFDPAIESMDAQKFDVTQAFRWDIAALLLADAAYFLSGWEKSQGANTEHAIAVSIGLQRMYETPRDEKTYMYLPHIAFVRPKGARRG